MAFCPNCGVATSGTSRFCASCGEVLARPAAPSAPAAPAVEESLQQAQVAGAPVRKTAVIRLAIVAALVVVVGGGALVSYRAWAAGSGGAGTTSDGSRPSREKPAAKGSVEWSPQAGRAVEAIARCWKSSNDTGAGVGDVAAWSGTMDSVTGKEPMSQEQKLELLGRNRREIEALVVPQGMEELHRIARVLVVSYERHGADNMRLLEIAAASRPGDSATSELIALQTERSVLASIIAENKPKLVDELERFLTANRVTGAELLAAAGKVSPIGGVPTSSKGASAGGALWVLVCSEEDSEQAAVAVADSFTKQWSGGSAGEEQLFLVDESSHYQGLKSGKWVVLYAWGGATEADANMEAVGLKDVSCIGFYAAQVVKTCQHPGPTIP